MLDITHRLKTWLRNNARVKNGVAIIAVAAVQDALDEIERLNRRIDELTDVDPVEEYLNASKGA